MIFSTKAILFVLLSYYQSYGRMHKTPNIPVCVFGELEASMKVDRWTFIMKAKYLFRFSFPPIQHSVEKFDTSDVNLAWFHVYLSCWKSVYLSIWLCVPFQSPSLSVNVCLSIWLCVPVFLSICPSVCVCLSCLNVSFSATLERLYAIVVHVDWSIVRPVILPKNVSLLSISLNWIS